MGANTHSQRSAKDIGSSGRVDADVETSQMSGAKILRLGIPNLADACLPLKFDQDA
jgi:hypothetical protein